MPKKQKDILVKDRQKIDRPKRYKVVLYNDDYTPMELVTSILIDVFNKGTQEAQTIMMKVHRGGRGVAGVYSKEIAETKVTTAKQFARDSGSPLHCESEPE
jgi:ATP-dependent Clp protease adaptor protein ClpS